MIRDYDPARDREQLRTCVVELQDSERRLEPTLPAGEAMADDYLAGIMALTPFCDKIYRVLSPLAVFCSIVRKHNSHSNKKLSASTSWQRRCRLADMLFACGIEEDHAMSIGRKLLGGFVAVIALSIATGAVSHVSSTACTRTTG